MHLALQILVFLGQIYLVMFLSCVAYHIQFSLAGNWHVSTGKGKGKLVKLFFFFFIAPYLQTTHTHRIYNYAVP